MSLGYADRLKQRRNLGGQLGAKEYHQRYDEIKEKTQFLTEWISQAERVFIFTGAGISTSCGIPDFRGPNGIWTLRKKKLPLPTDLTPFEYAKPSFTHMAISGLVATGKVPYVCSQNVDSLHLWSGVPRERLAELHGNCFAERCTVCRTEYDRDFQMETVDFKPSGRRCVRPGCDGVLVDNILDWETPLPEDELNEAVQQAEEADVALVLGTSLQIQPANEIPTLTRDEGGKMVIVNLQKTPKDRRANLIIRSRVDVVMALLVQMLGVQVPPYVRSETLVVEPTLHSTSSAEGNPAPKLESSSSGSGEGAAGRSLTVLVRSCHGRGCPIPMVESLTITLSAERDSSESAAAQDGDCGPAGTSSNAGSARSGASTDAGSEAAAPAGPDEDDPSRPEVDAPTEARAGAGPGSVAVWGPHSSGVLASTHSPAAAFPAASGGGYRATFAGLPAWARRVRCTLHLRLVRWADPDKREVTLQHDIDLDALPQTSGTKPDPGACQEPVLPPVLSPAKAEEVRPPAQALPAAATTSDGDVATAAPAVEAAAGVGPGAVRTGPPRRPFCPQGSCPDWGSLAPGAFNLSFESQRLQYDPADVVAAFLADPPPVVLPEPPRKRKKSESGDEGQQQPAAAGTAAPAGAATGRTVRVSGRVTRASYKARLASSEGRSAGGSGDSDGGEAAGDGDEGDGSG